METAYDPERIRALRRSTLAAIDELADHRCADPLAADAMRAVRLTRQNLEEQWMPLLDRIAASPALVTWTPAATEAIGVGVSATTRTALAEQLRGVLLRRPWTSEVSELIQAAHVTEAMRAALADPQECLDVLGDPAALLMLADWSRLPDDVVEAFVIAGLSTAVAERPGRLAEGYVALQRLTTFANGVVDDGARAGFTRGLAASLATYLPTLAPAIRHEGDAPVLVVDDELGLDIGLGSYDDLVDLVGMLLRDERSQLALGVSLGSYASVVVHDLGPALTERRQLTDVARVTDLVADAILAEQAELDAVAEASHAAKQRIGSTVSTGVTAALTVFGVGPAGRIITGLTIDRATDILSETDPDLLPDLSLPTATYDLITVTTMAMLAGDPSARAAAGLGGIAAVRWRELGERLERVRNATPAERPGAVVRLERWVDRSMPELARYLAAVHAMPGMEELTESRRSTPPD